MQEKYYLTKQNPISINNQIINISSAFSLTKQKGCMTPTQIPNLFLNLDHQKSPITNETSKNLGSFQ